MKGYSTLKEQELISQSALESSLAGFWDWNMLTNEEYLSPRFKEMFGYKEHEMENSPEAWQKIAFPEDLPGMFEAFEIHIKSKGTVPFESIVRYYHKNGETIWVKCSGKVVEWTKEGTPVRTIGCHIDITEEKKIELRLKKALKEKDILLSEIHHRVKNNLQLIQSLARLKSKRQKVDLHEIENIINAISSAHEAIYKSERFDKIDFKKYLERIISQLLFDQNIELGLISDKINEKINFLIPIGLIIVECVNNSIKHGFLNKLELKKIDLLIKEKEGQIIVVYKDNGPGYEEAILKSSQEHDSFGLVLMYSLAEQLEGSIELSNDNGAKMILTIANNSNKR
jgi:PAS domain S-box-containing protein